MTALEDTRPLAELSVIPRPDHRPEDLGNALQELLAVDPDIELASIRITTGQVDAGERISIAGRVGALVEPEADCDCYASGFNPATYEGPQHHCRVHGHGPNCCWSCHTQLDRPHTEYCQAGPDDHEPQLGTPEAIDQSKADLAGALREALDRARERRIRAHERDHEVDDGKGVTWHQTGPGEAHRRELCAPATCGWDQP